MMARTCGKRGLVAIPYLQTMKSLVVWQRDRVHGMLRGSGRK